MLAMLSDHHAITKAEFKRLCMGLGAEVTPPEAADIFEGIADSSGCADIQKVLGVLMSPEQAVKLCKQLKRPAAAGAAGANRPASSSGSYMSKSSRGSRGRAATPQKELPWKQRQSLQLVPNSHRDFLMQTKPQMQLGMRAQTPPLISSRSRYSTASSAPSAISSPQKTSRSAKQRAMQGKKWNWPSTLISEFPRGQYEVDRAPPTRDETCLLHERADSIKGFEHEWVWREANARKRETYCLLDMGLKGEYRDYMATKYGVTT